MATTNGAHIDIAESYIAEWATPSYSQTCAPQHFFYSLRYLPIQLDCLKVSDLICGFDSILRIHCLSYRGGKRRKTPMLRVFQFLTTGSRWVLQIGKMFVTLGFNFAFHKGSGDSYYY